MPRANTHFNTLLMLASATGLVMIPAAQAPDEITRLIKPNAVVDMAIVVAQNKPEALDDAEAIARTLTDGSGHYEVHTATGDLGRVAYPIIITYLSK